MADAKTELVHNPLLQTHVKASFKQNYFCKCFVVLQVITAIVIKKLNNNML